MHFWLHKGVTGYISLTGTGNKWITSDAITVLMMSLLGNILILSFLCNLFVLVTTRSFINSIRLVMW